MIFYHDGSFSTLMDVVIATTISKTFFTEAEKKNLIEYLTSL